MPRIRARRKVFVTRAIDPAALERLRAAAAVTVWRDEMPPPDVGAALARWQTPTRYSRWSPTRSTRA